MITKSDDSAGNGPGYLEVEISHAGGAWDMTAEEVVLRIAQAVYESEAMEGSADLSVLLADNAFVQSLNRKFRGKDKPTNVLSFPQAEGSAGLVFEPNRPLGDIAFAFETLVEEARAQDKSFDDHLAHLVAHGVLHLLGYDHETDGQADEMEALERAILKRFNIEDPYAAEGRLKRETHEGKSQ